MSNNKIKITWQKDAYDADGDLYDQCVVIWLSGQHAIRFDDVQELGEFIDSLINVKYEIESGG